MEDWEHDDYETPIENYPGYLGLCLEGTFMPDVDLKELEGFDFRHYARLLEDFGQDRTIHVAFGATTHTIVFEWWSYPSVTEILDKLPTVKVLSDNGPPNAGPGCGGAVVFFQAEGTSNEDLAESISALRRALDADLASLEEWQRQKRVMSP
jgi:hypothetical protein